MAKYFVGVGEYVFVVQGTVDGSQHWYGKLYPWTLNTNSIIERWIGDTLQSVWQSFSNHLQGQLVGVWIITFGQCLA
jgi:hypothetical protein